MHSKKHLSMANEFLAKMTRFQPKNSWKIKSITLDQHYTPFIRWPLIFKSIFLRLYVQNLQESCKIFSFHLLSVWIIDCSSLSNLRLHAVEQSLWEEQKRENVWQNRLSSDNDWAFFISFLKCIYIHKRRPVHRTGRLRSDVCWLHQKS